MIRSALLLLVILLLTGCTKKETTETLPPGKRYAMQGTVKTLDPKTKTADIDAGQIGDWMAPMTMPYPVKPDAEFQKLRVGDRIDATVVVVNDEQYYVTDVKVASAK